MKPYTLLFCYCILLILGYYAYIGWKRPEVLRVQLSRYARVYDGWNPGQAEALRSNSHLWTMRIAGVVMFVLSLALTGMVVLQYPSAGSPAADTVSPLFTLLLQAVLLELLYPYLSRHEVRGYVYYVIFVTVGLCFGLSFALLNGAVTADQYTLSLVACGAIGIQGAWIAMTRAPHKQR
jgi:hypothetical protein